MRKSQIVALLVLCFSTHLQAGNKINHFGPIELEQEVILHGTFTCDLEQKNQWNFEFTINDPDHLERQRISYEISSPLTQGQKITRYFSHNFSSNVSRDQFHWINGREYCHDYAVDHAKNGNTQFTDWTDTRDLGYAIFRICFKIENESTLKIQQKKLTKLSKGLPTVQWTKPSSELEIPIPCMD
jgi:hypothetical protein